MTDRAVNCTGVQSHKVRAIAAQAILGLSLIHSVAVAQTGAAVAGWWRIEQARSEPILDKRLARLSFGADGRLTGHTSCNELTATYALRGRELQVSAIAVGRNTCSQLQLEQEDRILTALELAASAAVRSDGLLELRDGEERGLLRATRLEPKSP